MLRSETLFVSARPAPLLGTMSKHFGHKITVETDGALTRMQFPMGTVTAEAREGGLHLLVEAADAEGVERVQEVLISHLMRFAHRENPQKPQWQPA